MTKDVEQKYTLLSDDEEGTIVSVKGNHASRYHKWAWPLLLMSVVYSLFVTVYMIHSTQDAESQLPWTPALDAHAVEYRPEDVENFPSSIYSSPPSPEVDEAWEKLISPIYYPASKEELERNGEDPDKIVRLKDGGYFAIFGVYHELHCVRRMYWHLHEDHYFPNRSESVRKGEIAHLRHCIELTLRTFKCTPNTALYSFHYDPEVATDPFIISTGQRNCIDWELFHGWAGARAVPYDPTPGLLVPGGLGGV